MAKKGKGRRHETPAADDQEWIQHIDRIVLFKEITESPIEQAFGEAFAALWLDKIDGPFVIGAAKDYPSDHRVREGLGIFTQLMVGPYRVDFMLSLHINGKYSFVVVECDGHDFHERTKEQARRDRSRDREMQMRGLRIIRFTGAEIYADARLCAEEALTHLIQALAEKRVKKPE